MTITAKLADGRTLEFPDGTDPSVIQTTVQRVLGASREKAQQQVANDSITRGARNFAADMPLGAQMLAGSGKAFSDMWEGTKQQFGFGLSPQETREMKARDRALMDTTGGIIGNVATTVGALAPLAVVPGANTIGGSIALGATIAGAQPAESWGERLGNMATGGALGGAVQAASNIPRAVYLAKDAGRAFSEPLHDAGQDQIIGRLLHRVSGGHGDEVANRLALAQELVTGSKPTAAQAGGNAGLAALERTAVATNPTVMEAHRAQLSAQNAARVNALKEMAGEGGRRSMMTAMRDDAAEELYGAARALGLDESLMTAARRGEVTKLLNNPYMKQATDEARKLAKGEFKNVRDPSGSMIGLDYTKRALDDMIGRAHGNEQRILVGLKDRFLTTVDKLSPAYKQARETYAEMSRIPNQMGTAAEIADKSIRKLDDVMTPAAYARALSDDAAVAATKFNKATLANTMEPEQMALLEAIKQDLARSEFAKNAGRGAGSDTAQKLAMNNIMETVGVHRVPMLLNRWATLGKWGMEKVYGKADAEIAQKLAEALLDPQKTAALMSGTRALPKGPTAQDVEQLGRLSRALALPAIPAATER